MSATERRVVLCGILALGLILRDGASMGATLRRPDPNFRPSCWPRKVTVTMPPQEMISCHTGRIEGYIIEGHVPVADIRRLLEERPDAVGLAVPGMPYGSPGMGPESEREAYEVFLIRRDGSTEVYANYSAA
ncbi:MAG: hypothetical protein KDA73_18075 [Rhodobacteraceae bacterium]|nr:hypothetical protein [Paracoccaceae bacterium]